MNNTMTSSKYNKVIISKNAIENLAKLETKQQFEE